MKLHSIGYIHLVLVAFLLHIVKNVNSANILAIFSHGAKSHHIMLEKIAKGLAVKGHEIDIYSHFPLKESVKGYNDFSLAGTIPILTGKQTLDSVKEWKHFRKVLHIMTGHCGVNNCEPLFNSKALKDLRNTTKKYDLLITEVFGTDCMLGFAHHFKVPSVLLVTGPNYPWSTDYCAVPDNPAYIPNHLSAFSPKMAFHERLINTMMLVISKIYYRYYSLEPSNRLAREFFGSDMPHLDTLLRNASIQILNTHFSINQARPYPPNFIEVGGIHIEEPKPLNEHFSKLVDLETDQKGVIYFTLGSIVQTETMPDEMIQGMSNALGKLPYKVLWKAKRENIPKHIKFANNIHFEWWMPQFDILCHPNVKLYISHGGNAGVEEAAYCGVPVLGIPIFGDQELNIAQLIYLGTALRVDLKDINEENIYDAAFKLLNEPTYQEAAKKLQSNFKDRPMTPLETAVFWIEYVIRHQGAPELKSVATELYWYQYHLIDVILVLVSVPCLSVYLVYLLLKKYCRRTSDNNKNQSSKGQTKIKKSQ